MGYVIGFFLILIIVTWILDAFGVQIGIGIGLILLGFCAYGAFKAFKNYAAAFKKNTIDSNRS